MTPGAKLGPYEVISLLGAGGMGEVYRARDTRLSRVVAIKVLPADRMADENRRRRFVQEARAASALNHPNIVTIHEIESADGIDFIVMEYVEGKTLDGVIPRQGLKLGEALRIAIPIADALARAHAAGIVHRDLKPANVVVGSDGTVKILDFGLAKLVTLEPGNPDHETVSDDGDAGPLSRPGTVAGTAGYMSPEQATGKAVDARSDIFSFGAVLYEMVTGQRAFSGNSTAETLAAVVRDQPKAPSEVVPGVPKELERLISRCLQKALDRRFQHIMDVKVELQEIKEESESGSAAWAGPARPGPRRWLAIGLASALALGALGWLLWRSRVEVPPPTVGPLTSTPGWATQPTFSPDGNQVAFAWNGEKQDNSDIYIKMVGSAETRRLTTDPADDGSPSWSPDGRQIAFIRDRGSPVGARVHLVSPLGGSDRTLSDQPVSGEQVSWSHDARWLAAAGRFDPGASLAEGRGIQLIAVSDGAAHWITFPGPRTFHTDPAFSPDGRHLAYVSCLGLACYVDIVDLETDSAPKGASRRLTRRLFTGPAGLAFTRDGQSVVYGEEMTNRLWRVGIAGDRPPERIEIAGYAALPAVALSRDRLAFARPQANREIDQFEAGRPPKVVAASSAATWTDDCYPHFSPDGRRFAFESGRGGEGQEIWLAAADGTNPTRLTHGPGQWQGSPRWSPDGARIAFDSRDVDGHWGIWTVEVDGGSLHRLTSVPEDNLPSWSQDGRSVYFSSDRTGAYNVWRVPAGGGIEEQITHDGGGFAHESADGKTLFFRRPGSHSPLLAVPVAGGLERKVVDCVDSFTVGAAGVYHVGCGADHESLHLLDPATGRDHLLGKLDGFVSGLTVSPDGKTFLYTRWSGGNSGLMMIENFR